MEFKIWYEQFTSNKENFSKLTLEEMLETAFVAGEVHIVETSPHVGVSEDGKISQLPLETSLPLPEGGRWATDDEINVEMDKWLKERSDNATN